MDEKEPEYWERGGGRGRRRGTGAGRGYGRGRRLGRPRITPVVSSNWKETTGKVKLVLSNHEIEVIKLLDFDGLTQEQAAIELNVSRGSIWRYTDSARKKIAKAIISGNEITIIVE